MTKISSPLQLTQSVIINVPIEKIWAVFNDLSLRPKWTCDVQKINYNNKTATVGEEAITDCIVNGKKGNLTTKCVALHPTKRAEFIVVKDTFGINKMLLNLGFATEFEPINNEKTEFTMLSHYQPKNLIIK